MGQRWHAFFMQYGLLDSSCISYLYVSAVGFRFIRRNDARQIIASDGRGMGYVARFNRSINSHALSHERIVLTDIPILTFSRAFADVDNVEANFDLAMRSNKWEGEDEEEDVKVRQAFVHMHLA